MGNLAHHNIQVEYMRRKRAVGSLGLGGSVVGWFRCGEITKFDGIFGSLVDRAASIREIPFTARELFFFCSYERWVCYR